MILFHPFYPRSRWSYSLFRFTGIEFFGSNRCIFDGQHCIRYGEQTGGLLSSFSKWHYRRALACWYYGGIAIGTHLVESLYEARFLFQQTCIFTTCFFNFHIMLNNMILTFCQKKQDYGCMNASSERISIRYVERRYGKAASIPVTK